LTSNMHFLSRLTPTPLLYTIWKIYLVATDHCYMAVWHLSIVSILASFSTHQLPLKSILYLLCTRLSKKSVNTCSYPGILPYPAEFWLQQSENTTKDSNITLCFATNCECSYRWSCNMLWGQFWRGKISLCNSYIMEYVTLSKRICYDLISNKAMWISSESSCCGHTQIKPTICYAVVILCMSLNFTQMCICC
jgi:hypothetical protein